MGGFEEGWVLLVLQRVDIGFVEETWAGDSGVLCVGVCVFYLFFILSFAIRSQPLKFLGRFLRPCLIFSLRCEMRQRLTSLERISPPKSPLRRDSGAKISCGSSTLTPRE